MLYYRQKEREREDKKMRTTKAILATYIPTWKDTEDTFLICYIYDNFPKERFDEIVKEEIKRNPHTKYEDYFIGETEMMDSF